MLLLQILNHKMLKGISVEQTTTSTYMSEDKIKM